MNELDLPFAVQEQRIRDRLCAVCEYPQGVWCPKGRRPHFLCVTCRQEWAICGGCRRILKLEHFHRSLNTANGRARFCPLCTGYTTSHAERAARRERIVALCLQQVSRAEIARMFHARRREINQILYNYRKQNTIGGTP